MKVSCNEGVANHVGPESLCGGGREAAAEALTEGKCGLELLSSEILNVRDADAVMSCGRQHRSNRQARGSTVIRGVEDPSGRLVLPMHAPTHLTRRRSLLFGSREIPVLTPDAGSGSVP